MLEKNIHLTDLIEPGMLRKIESSFSGMLGIAAWVSDAKGVGFTSGSGFNDYANLCMKSAAGRKECEHCIREGAVAAHKAGKAVRTDCFGGLAVYSAPITLYGSNVGILSAGWVPTDVMNYSDIERTAKRTGEKAERLATAAAELRILPAEEAQRAAAYVYEFAGQLSDMAQKMDQMRSSANDAKGEASDTDLVADVSSDMRKPLSEILQMSEMALQSSYPKDTKEYLHQIRSSGRHLLTIINDIMDYSSIESGNMAIVEVKYDPQSLVNATAEVVNTQIGDKNIDFTVDFPVDMPKQLMGDNVRIQQILINLLSNAVKNTESGNINMKFQSIKAGSSNLLLRVEISDTGRGMKQEELDGLFTHTKQELVKTSFGEAGLGLIISKRLLELMKGSISVKSEYGKGSVFTFQIPQKYFGGTYRDDVHADGQHAWLFVRSDYVRNHLTKDLLAVGIKFTNISKFESCGEKGCLIVSSDNVTDELAQFVCSHQELKCIILDRFDSDDCYDMSNVRVLHYPEYSVNLYGAMGLCRSIERDESASSDDVSFTAPDASILIVDDNEINLEVAKGVIEPLEMEVDTASSAAEAIEKTLRHRYDMVIMDYLMPEMNGVEAMHAIREKNPNYADVPIIALTANDGSTDRDMFLREGMNDYIAKPINLKEMVAKVRRWLPQEKMIPTAKLSQSAVKLVNILPQIDGVDTDAALALLNSESLLRVVMKQFCRSAERTESYIRKLWKSNDIKQFTIEVHSLKSTARQIGANHLSQMAALLEQAGNRFDLDFISRNTNAMLTEYIRISQELTSYFAFIESENNGAYDDSQVSAQGGGTTSAEPEGSLLDEMQEAINEMDTIQIDDVLEKMEAKAYPQEEQQYYEKLRDAAEECDLDAASEIIAEWKKFNPNA